VFYQRKGDVPRKPFTVHYANGLAVHEEMLTSAGFTGPSSLLYHLRPATAVIDILPLEVPPPCPWEDNLPHNHRLDLTRFSPLGAYSTSRVPLFFNDDFMYSLSCPATVSHEFFRNSAADELLLIISGSGRVATVFGSIPYGPLDLIYIPRGVTYRLEGPAGAHVIAVVETCTPLWPPGQYRGTTGQLSYLGLYQEGDLRTPEFEGAVDDPSEHEVVVKMGPRFARHIVPAHPFDAVGWTGALYPYSLSMKDLTPMSSRLHPTPDLYQIFGSDGISISAIVPARLPDHEQSTAAQPDHSADWDEVFHRVGRRQSDGHEPGSVTLHTRGTAHGAAIALKEKPRRETSNGYGLIIDARRPVSMAHTAVPGDEPDYYRSWAADGGSFTSKSNRRLERASEDLDRIR
jgi:homogentisate 1,2-dioxygenase